MSISGSASSLSAITEHDEFSGEDGALGVRGQAR